MTEDAVRDKAKEILGFENTETAISGVGQLTTFNQLGFKGVNDKPDGWYLPNERHFPAIILETKNSAVELRQQQIDELLKNCRIVATKYKNVVGILYNGDDVLCFKNCQPAEVVKDLMNKEYYLGLFEEDTIDKLRIYTLTKRINDSLHINFGIKNFNHRMIFTACALVAKRYGATLVKGMTYNTFRNSIFDTLSKSYADAIRQNSKLNLLLDVYSEIKMNITDNQEAIDDFIDYVSEISDNINSDFWQGEDVMAIFFNEFSRYNKKPDLGQVLTPDHITSLMYRIIETNKDDIVLDAACGSGAFLVKSMCNMIKEAGGNRTDKAKIIKQKQLYGIEIDREIFALACANMLIHKDGKTNLEQLDSRSEEAAKWIASKKITKVLMNPPFERAYGCMAIVQNVLDNVQPNALCAFILPDNKLEKGKKNIVSKILKRHSLLKIVKLPENVFPIGSPTSVFIFKAGVPQDDKEVFACYIEDDGLETVKNQGRQDINDRWKSIENRWIEIIRKQSGSDTIQWINPHEHLSYQMAQKAFEIYEVDFAKTAMDYMLFENGIDEKQDEKQLAEEIAKKVLYSASIMQNDENINIKLNLYGYDKN